jgi:hypothetical protein
MNALLKFIIQWLLIYKDLNSLDFGGIWVVPFAWVIGSLVKYVSSKLTY